MLGSKRTIVPSLLTAQQAAREYLQETLYGQRRGTAVKLAAVHFEISDSPDIAVLAAFLPSFAVALISNVFRSDSS